MSRSGVQLCQADRQGLPGEVCRGGAQRRRACTLCPDAAAAVEAGARASDAQTVRVLHQPVPAELRAPRRAENHQDEIPEQTERWRDGVCLGGARPRFRRRRLRR